MDAIVEQIKSLAASADDAAHRDIVDMLRMVLFAVEQPEDTLQRIIFLV